jgi:hypothetical protein
VQLGQGKWLSRSFGGGAGGEAFAGEFAVQLSNGVFVGGLEFEHPAREGRFLFIHNDSADFTAVYYLVDEPPRPGC